MSGPKNHYDVLRIKASATTDEIEQAYRRRITRLHGKIAAGNLPPREDFDALELAYAILRDPVSRADYDATLSPRPRQAAPQPPVRRQSRAPLRASGEEVRYDFSFAGSGGEYFRIWIVNLLLSILTLGIYSAWAKVRREKYFHRNTLLDGSSFEYHGQPIPILKGRIVGTILFGGLSYSQHVSNTAYLLALCVFAFIMPWMMTSAYRFRSRNTSYRGLHFSFAGTYREALTVFVGYGILTLLTLYLLFPVWMRKMRMYVVNNLRYGQGRLFVDVSVGAVYKLMLIPIGLIALIFLLGILAGVFKSPVLAILMGFIIPFLMFGSLILIPYIQMRLNNLFWSNTLFEEHRFESNMRFNRYLAILLKNWFLMMLTLGLYWPWARVALMKYRLSCTGIFINGSLDEFIATANAHSTAIGDQTADIFDFDVGF